MESAKFRLKELVILLCAVGLVFPLLVPVLAENIRTSRMAVCMNNMKAIGVGLEMWRKNAKTGGYPIDDLPGFGGTSRSDLNPWCEMIGMVYPFTPENIEAERDYLESMGMLPEDFSKTVDSMHVFRCPADNPHPHRINEGRADDFGYNPFEYSYTLSAWVVGTKDILPLYAKDASGQILSADGLWDWSVDLTGYYVDDPGHQWNSPTWRSNTVGYLHGNDSANFVLRDGHVENHRWDPAQGLPDTEDVYFREPGEDHNHYHPS